MLMRWRALVPMPSYHPISDADPGTTFGNHRANFPRHPGASPGMVFAVQLLELTPRAATRSLSLFALQARGHRFSSPVPTRWLTSRRSINGPRGAAASTPMPLILPPFRPRVRAEAPAPRCSPASNLLVGDTAGVDSGGRGFPE